MPTRAASATAATSFASVANTRILRLAFGTALSLWISQAVGWDLSFIAPVVTMFLLALPLSQPQPKLFVVVVLALAVGIYGSFVFLPLLLHQKFVGLLLLSLALFHSFYFTARGGTNAVGSLATIGIAVTVAVGTVTVDGLLDLASGFVLGAAVGAVVAMLSHRLIPDPLLDLPVKANDPPEKEVKIDLPTARHDAMRSLAIVLPILIWFAVSSASAANAAVMIKVSAMGQEVSRSSTHDAAKSLIVSTIAGGIGATIAWQFLSIWPSLTMYVLLIAFAGLIFGRRIFEGRGLHADAATWSYAFLTMIIVLAPAVLDSSSSTAAGARFYDRLFMFGWATLYAVVAVYVFDAFWKRPVK
jgi:large-conductance mechanosensitive channel